MAHAQTKSPLSYAPVYLPQLHTFQNLSSWQRRVKRGFRGVCLMSLTSQFVQAATSQTLNKGFVIYLLPFSTYCPAFPYSHYFAFKELLKIPNWTKVCWFPQSWHTERTLPVRTSLEQGPRTVWSLLAIFPWECKQLPPASWECSLLMLPCAAAPKLDFSILFPTQCTPTRRITCRASLSTARMVCRVELTPGSHTGSNTKLPC